MGIATFNSILHHMRNRNADSMDDDIFEDELHNTIRRLNFAEEQNEAKAILSDLQSMAEIQKNCLVEYVLCKRLRIYTLPFIVKVLTFAP